MFEFLKAYLSAGLATLVYLLLDDPDTRDLYKGTRVCEKAFLTLIIVLLWPFVVLFIFQARRGNAKG